MEYVRPAIEARWTDLTADQQAVVIAHLDSSDPTLAKNFFNYNAEPGKKAVKTLTQGPVTDYSNADVYWGDVGAPAANADFASLSAAQKQLVAASLGYEVYESGVWYNAGADAGLRVMTGFASGQAADFDLDKIDWGGPQAPDDNASFEQLTAAQRAVVVAQLGYAQIDRQVFYNATAEAGEQVRVDFTQGSGGDYENKDVVWGEVAKPADSTAFGNLTYDQQNQVLAHLGYARWDGVVYFDADATADQQYRLSFEQGADKDYENADMVWSAVATPLLSHKIDVSAVPVAGDSYSIVIDGVDIRYTARAAEGSQPADTTTAHLVAGLVNAINSSGLYGAIAVGNQIQINDGDAGGKAVVTTSIGVVGEMQSRDLSYAALTATQQFHVLDQTGFVQYTQTTYVDTTQADAFKRVLTAFTEGVDYTNAGMDWGSTGTQQSTRWIVDDGSNRYVIYAYDDISDGTGDIDEIHILEPHVLLGQRGFGFLLAGGTITTLQANADFVVSGQDDAIVRGNINLLGAGSDLTIQSDKWTYWEGGANVTGNITLLGGVELDGSNPTGKPNGGANADGVSLYIHAATTLNTTTAGTHIVLAGGQDVEIHGRVIAGGEIGDAGVTWLGADSTISVTAGQQILVNTALSAAKSVTLTTTATPGADDNGFSVIVGSAAGLTAAGITSNSDGGLVKIDAKGSVTINGMVLSGGVVTQTFGGPNQDVLLSETIAWSAKNSTIDLKAAGQLWLGGMAKTEDGDFVEIGGTFRANDLIKLQGGSNSDGIGIKMPGGARIATSNADGRIIMISAQDAELYGQVVAGGEVLDHFDSRGLTLGSSTRLFNGDSSIAIRPTARSVSAAT
jgi:hypothetical protein